MPRAARGQAADRTNDLAACLAVDLAVVGQAGGITTGIGQAGGQRVGHDDCLGIAWALVGDDDLEEGNLAGVDGRVEGHLGGV